jgi:uncharacterized membrane protein
MEISMKTIILLAAVLLTGLSAGLFYAWSVSVIPGTKKLVDLTYLETMQSINRAILNPLFFLVFLGSALLLFWASINQFQTSNWAFAWVVGSLLTYLIGTIGVTGMGNVPLNNELDILNLAEMSSDKIAAFRAYYESNWNRLHTLRTVFAVLSFLLALVPLVLKSK